MESKKMKLPQHLQLDSISPATRLLEMRRDMYEAQNAYNKAKVTFQQNEDAAKLAEQELREQDILIQDHLIKFSTFLQQHEDKKANDIKKTKDEQEEIDQKNQMIQKKKTQIGDLSDFGEKVEAKVQAMAKFEKFLQDVKNKNSDEFTELNDILQRHSTLSESNAKLKTRNAEIQAEVEALAMKITETKSKKNTEKMQLNNDIALKQKLLEQIEEARSKMMSESEIMTKKKLQQTTEHGQILLTVSSIFEKFKDEKNLITSKDDLPKEQPRTIDDIDKATKLREGQLKVLLQVARNIKDVNAKLAEDPEMQKKLQEYRQTHKNFDAQAFKPILNEK